MKKKTKILLVIPARYASSRLPGKPLCYLEGAKNIKKTLIERTWLLAQSLKITCKIVIATDDKILFKRSSIFAKPIALIKKGRLLKLEKCQDEWCKVKTNNFSGWIDKKNIWGNVN